MKNLNLEKVKVVLFDLDGTLLPMDQDEFVEVYMSELAKIMAGYGYSPKELVKTVWMGTEAMVRNDGACSNEEAFWKLYADKFGTEAMEKAIPVLDKFYQNEFQKAKEVCGSYGSVNTLIKSVKKQGYRVALATNPIFPRIATFARIKWAGMEAEDFELVTTYEDYHFCKPNPKYFEEILEKLGCRAEECLMIGNDVEEDMVAGRLGMQVCLVTDCLINKKDKDVTEFPHGTFAELTELFCS